MSLGLAVIFEYFQKLPCFRVFFDLTQFNRQKLWCPLKSMLFNYSSLSYIVLPLTSAVSNLSDITLTFHDFPGLENEILKFHNLPGFPWPVRTLYTVHLCGSTLLRLIWHHISMNSAQYDHQIVHWEAGTS